MCRRGGGRGGLLGRADASTAGQGKPGRDQDRRLEHFNPWPRCPTGWRAVRTEAGWLLNAGIGIERGILLSDDAGWPGSFADFVVRRAESPGSMMVWVSHADLRYAHRRRVARHFVGTAARIRARSSACCSMGLLAAAAAYGDYIDG